MRSFLRTGLGDMGGGLGTGKMKLICYLSSFRELELSVKQLGGSLAGSVHQKTNLVCCVRSLTIPYRYSL